jgi:hypothetical protein
MQQPVRDHGSETFEQQAAEVLGDIRAVCAAAIEAIPRSINSAADLSRACRLETKLAWKLYRIARSADPLAAAAYVPSKSHLRTFLKAIKEQDLPAALLDRASLAVEGFSELVSKHAGDRATFDSMISSLSRSKDADAANLQNRRAAFRANRHIWGAQARSQAKILFVQPSEDGEMLDFACIEGYVDLVRLRPDAPLVVAASRVTDDDYTVREVARHPLDPSGASELGIGLLPEFSSQPLPEFSAILDKQGFTYGELASNGLGHTGATTCMTGWSMPRGARRHRCENNETAECCVMVRVPCEWLLMDVLVRRDLVDRPQIRTSVYSDHKCELPYPSWGQRLDHLFTAQELGIHIGRGSSVTYSPHLPRLIEITRFVFDRLGWDGDVFDVYRCCLSYPIMPSTIRVSFDLPEKQ